MATKIDRRKTGIAVALMAGCAFLPAAARMADTPTVTATMADSGRAMKLTLGQKLRIRLPTQPGTGFSWQVVPGSAPMLSLDNSVVKGEATMPGGNQIQVLRFTANSIGKGQLDIEYRRPWERARKPANTFSLTIKVFPPLLGAPR